jgi:hypothetical protein
MSALMLELERRWEGPPSKHQIAVWKSSLPFVENSRGVLIHRPRAVTQYKLGRWPEHIGIGYWCGNSVSGNKNITFLSEPPTGKLLCAICEARATLAGRPSADNICGKHIHLGRVVAVQVCCSTPQGSEK